MLLDNVKLVRRYYAVVRALDRDRDPLNFHGLVSPLSLYTALVTPVCADAAAPGSAGGPGGGGVRAAEGRGQAKCCDTAGGDLGSLGGASRQPDLPRRPPSPLQGGGPGRLLRHRSDAVSRPV